MTTAMKVLMAAVVLGGGALLSDARAGSCETVYVRTVVTSPVVVLAPDVEIRAEAPRVSRVTVVTVKPAFVRKVVWVEPTYVMECWEGRWVKAYKPGHYKEVWVPADKA